MKIGLRSVLLLAAVLAFVVAIFVERDQFRWVAAGLALFAGSFLAADLAPGFGGRLRRRV